MRPRERKDFQGKLHGKGGAELGPSRAQSRSCHGIAEVAAACVAKSSLRNPWGSSSRTEHLGSSPSPKQKQPCLVAQTHTPLISGDKARRSERWLGRRVRLNGRGAFSWSLRHLFLLLIATIRRRCGGVEKVRMRRERLSTHL